MQPRIFKLEANVFSMKVSALMQVYSKGSSRGKPSTQKHTFVASFLLLLLVGGSKVQFAFPDIHAFA